MRGIELHIPAAAADRGGDRAAIGPDSGVLEHCGLRVVELAPEVSRNFASGPSEIAVLPLSGGALTVEVDGVPLALAGRASVFSRITDWAYVPIDAHVTLTSRDGCEVALASARATRRLEPRAVPAADVPVEIRGAGSATRQVTNFLTPEAFAGADKLICCEVLTPDGNWSSYPPHKHDGSDDSPVENEEIYYFRIGRAGSADYAPEGYGLHRTYTDDGSIDVTVAVRDGDVFVVPRGYHGPCVAAPGYPMYYLNVMAGPAEVRKMAFVDDPRQHWIRSTWSTMETDPRCPMTSSEGPLWRR